MHFTPKIQKLIIIETVCCFVIRNGQIDLGVFKGSKLEKYMYSS